MSFEAMNLKPEILQGIADLYYKNPTPIQKEAIPLALEGKDIIGQAQTGTGKTAAFVIPILQKLEEHNNDIQALIITPTRELALQIVDDINELGKYMNVNVLSLHGGQDINTQIAKLKGKIQIVVGTPGRILDHLNRKTLHFGRIKTLVLDEADKLLEMGFLEEIEEIFQQTSSRKQVFMYTATLPDSVRKLAHLYMNQPQIIRIEKKQMTATTTSESYYVVNQSEKFEALLEILENIRPYLVVIFANTKTRVNELVRRLQEKGYDAEALHGDFSQKKREQIMERFRKAKFTYLVATDIAARGLDVEGVTHVINYDFPSDLESYIHRVGRTGRAGQEGEAISLVSPRQKKILNRFLKSISGGATEKFLGKWEDKEKEKKKTEPEVKKEEKSPDQENKNKSKEKKKKIKVKPGYKKKLRLLQEKLERKERRKKIENIYRKKNN